MKTHRVTANPGSDVISSEGGKGGEIGGVLLTGGIEEAMCAARRDDHDDMMTKHIPPPSSLLALTHTHTTYTLLQGSEHSLTTIKDCQSTNGIC